MNAFAKSGGREEISALIGAVQRIRPAQAMGVVAMTSELAALTGRWRRCPHGQDHSRPFDVGLIVYGAVGGSIKSNEKFASVGRQRISSEDPGEMRESLTHLAVIDICRAVAGTIQICAIGEFDVGDRYQRHRHGIDRLATLLCPEPDAGNAFSVNPIKRRASKWLTGSKFSASTPTNGAAPDRTVAVREIRPIKAASATRTKATARNPARGPIKASP